MIAGLYTLWQLAGEGPLSAGGYGGAFARARWIEHAEHAVGLPSEARLNNVLTEVDVIKAAVGTAWQVIAEFARKFDLTIVEQSDTAGRRSRTSKSKPPCSDPGGRLSSCHIFTRLRYGSTGSSSPGTAVPSLLGAIGDAMPLLVKTGQVHIVAVVPTSDKQIEIQAPKLRVISRGMT